jgi:hypothetical protein
MLRGGHSVGQAPPADDEATTASPSLAPLVIFAAGPGTITAVVILAAVHTPDGSPVTAIVAAVIGAAVTLAALLLAIGIGSHPSRSTQALVTLHGAHCGVYENAVRADGIEGVLEYLDDRFHESCHKRGIHLSFPTPIYVTCAQYGAR